MIIDEKPTSAKKLNLDVADKSANLVAKLGLRETSQRVATAEEVHKLLEKCSSYLQLTNELSELEQPEFLVELSKAPAVNRPAVKKIRDNAGIRLRKWVMVAGGTALMLTVGLLGLVHGSLHELRADVEVSASVHPDDRNELENFFKLTPGKQYGVEVPRSNIIDHQTDWVEIWKAGKPLPVSLQQQSAKRPAGKMDKDRISILGTWKVTYAEDSGRVTPTDALKDIRFVIEEKTMITELGERTSVATYRLDPSTTPKSIDINENGRTKPGIYDLQGDTLRICISEHSDDRPTKFDSQPNSANDLIILMKRVRPGEAKQDKDSPAPKEDELPTARYLRKLIPQAASISNKKLKKLTTSPQPDAVENKSLSLVLMTLPRADSDSLHAKDFRYLGDTIPKPSELAKAMSLSKSKGYFSMIQPDYINELKIDPAKANQNTVFGHVKFLAPKLYRGQFRFRASKKEGKWRIDDFTLANRGIHLQLGENGKWKQVPAKPGVNQKIEND